MLIAGLMGCGCYAVDRIEVGLRLGDRVGWVGEDLLRLKTGGSAPAPAGGGGDLWKSSSLYDVDCLW